MRVALLALHFAEYTARLAIGLAREHDVKLLLNAKNARDELSAALLERLEREVELELVEVPRLRNPRVLATIDGLRRSLRRYRPDVVHMQEFHQAFTGPSIMALRRRVPVVMTVHDAMPHSGSIAADGWRWRVVKGVRQLCNRIIVHGSSNRRDLENGSGRLRGQVDIVPHGILGRDAVDDSLHADDPPAFLFFGRIERYKGLEYLLDAQQLLAERGESSRIVIAGRGNDLDRHRARIAEVPGVELLDRFIPTEDLEALFRRAHAVVLPYTDATQSGVSAMAFAYARPVIATDVGDVPEIVVNDRSGLIVPPRNPAALADAMQATIHDRALRDRLARGAVDMARDTLCWNRIAERTAEVYRRALRGYRAPA